jgi:hypothetical protein
VSEYVLFHDRPGDPEWYHACCAYPRVVCNCVIFTGVHRKPWCTPPCGPNHSGAPPRVVRTTPVHPGVVRTTPVHPPVWSEAVPEHLFTSHRYSLCRHSFTPHRYSVCGQVNRSFGPHGGVHQISSDHKGVPRTSLNHTGGCTGKLRTTRGGARD